MLLQHNHEERIRFWIFARNQNSPVKEHQSVLELLGASRLIFGESDAYGQGYVECLLNGIANGVNACQNSDCFWLIDEGLAMDWISMAALIDETGALDPDFAIFEMESSDRNHSVNPPLPLARLRMGLARKILDCPMALRRLKNEGLAAAVAKLSDETVIVEWGKHDCFRRFFRSGFPFCENPEVVPGIHFPVTDPKTQEEICALNFDLAERMGSRVLPYTGNKTRGWFVEDAERWTHWFGSKEPTRALEIAATDGISTNAMLDLLFPHPESEVHTIQTVGDLPGASETLERFTANAAAGGHTQRIHLYTGLPLEVLAWMIANDGYWESFDFIHFKPVADPVVAMTAAGQAWSLLKPGGVMLLDSGTARI